MKLDLCAEGADAGIPAILSSACPSTAGAFVGKGFVVAAYDIKLRVLRDLFGLLLLLLLLQHPNPRRPPPRKLQHPRRSLLRARKLRRKWHLLQLNSLPAPVPNSGRHQHR
jgi:uncharacterized membrane protein YfcA